jgi:hypothetical protein
MPKKRKERQKPMTEMLSEYFSRLGRKGGKARAEGMTREERRQLARKAALAKWDKQRKERGAK